MGLEKQVVLAALVTIFLIFASVQAQSTSFTYQGRLADKQLLRNYENADSEKLRRMK